MGAGGGAVPAFARRKQPVPKVHFASPGVKHDWPKSADCWSPAMPVTGIVAPRNASSRTDASHAPNAPAESRISGSTARGTRKIAQSASSHAQPAAPPMRASSVRDAFDASVACTRPFVSFHSTQESIVPAASSPASARARAPGTASRIHASFVALKYGSSVRPVAARTASSWPSARNSTSRDAVRRSCHTTARWIGFPVARSHTTIVSRWFVMPIAAMSEAARFEAASASFMHAASAVQISSASCSTQPGFGKCCANSRCPVPISLAAPSGSIANTIPRTLVVPQSSARM